MTKAQPPQRFQHLELVFPRGTLTPAYCEEIDSFWCGIFGWESDDVHYPELDDLRQHRIHCHGQSLVLAEGEHPMQMPYEKVGLGEDETVVIPHLGIELENLEEVERLLASCQEFQAKDPRVKLWDAGERRYPGHGGLHHAFLVMFLLPIWFDVYSTRHDPGMEPLKVWQYVDNPVRKPLEEVSGDVA
jgi:hypothetical protein